MYRNPLIIALVLSLATACSSDDGPVPPSIKLQSQTEIAGNLTTDVWGYIDESTNREYAITGDFSNLRTGNVTIVEVTDPVNPQIISSLDIIGFDVKTFNQYLYATNSDFASAESKMSQIVDINNPAAPVVVGTFQEAHNIFIDGTHLYVSFEFAPGLRIFDLAQDPTNPQLVWEDTNPNGGHDVAVIRNRMYDFHATDATYIYDIQDPSSPQLISTIRNQNTYHHSGWVTEDNNYLFICDETAADPLADITIWDISDLNAPVMVGEISDNTSRAHNLYIIEELAYVSYYGAGLKIFDVSTPASPKILDEFKTNLNGGNGIGNGFIGAFGVYPFSPSGNIFVTDMDNGLFVFRFE